MMPPVLVRHRRPLILAGHAFIVAAAYAVAFLLRFDGPVPPDEVVVFELTVMPLVIIRLAVFAAYGWPSTLGDDEVLERLLALNLERAAQSGAAAPGNATAEDDEES